MISLKSLVKNMKEAKKKLINLSGKKHNIYSSKLHKFTTPAFNHDEVETPPQNSILLASDKINKFMT